MSALGLGELRYAKKSGIDIPKIIHMYVQLIEQLIQAGIAVRRWLQPLVDQRQEGGGGYATGSFFAHRLPLRARPQRAANGKLGEHMWLRKWRVTYKSE